MAVPSSRRYVPVGIFAAGVLFGLMAILAIDGDRGDPAVRLIAAPPGTPIRHTLPAVVTGSTSWSLRDNLSTGPPTVGPFTYGTTPLVPLFGDWDGNGSKTPGTYEAGVFKLRNSNSAGAPDLSFPFGDPRGFTVAGDFNGDGTDDVAVYRNGLWQIHYIGAGVPADTSFTFGSGSWPSTMPVIGDWNGDGTDGIGTYILASGTWSLRNTASAGVPDFGPFVFWSGTSASRAVTGDWDANGTDTVGVKAGTTWSLTNTPGGGAVQTTFDFGAATDLPLTWKKAGPALTGIESAPLAYTTGTPAASVTSTILVTDPDKTTLTGATITIAAPGYQNGADVLSFTNQLGITGSFSAATGTLTLSGTAPLADYQTALRAVRFSTSSSNTAPRTVTLQVNDGSVLDNLSNPLSRDIAVTPPPASVVVTKSEPTPGAGTTVVAGQTTITYRFSVVNSGGVSSGPVTISDTVPSGTTLVAGSQTCPAGLNAGSTPSCTTSTGPPLSWTISSVPALTTYDSFGFQVTVNASAANGSTVTNQATFTNVNTPGCGTPTCTTNTINNTVNVPPTATIAPANGATDIPANSTITVTFSEPVTLTNPAFTLECPPGTAKAFTVAPASPATVFTLTPTTPFASFASCTVTVVAGQVTDAGGAHMTANATSSFQVAATPTTVPQNYSGAVGNTIFGVGTTPAQPSSSTTGSVLDGATNGGAGTLSALTAPITSTNGGTVTMSSNGTFTYLPPVGFTGNDTFTYTVTNTFHTASNTVTIAVGGKVWYIDNSLGAAGTGRSTSPFNSLTPVNGANGAGDSDGPGDFIFLKTGSGHYAGGLALETNQQLIGQPESLVVNAVTLWTGTGTNPTITNAAGIGISLASGTVIRRVNVANTSSAGISGSSITTADIGPNLTVTNSAGAGFSLFGAAGGNVTFAGSITHSSAAGRAVFVANRSSGTVTISGPVTDTAGGVLTNLNTGATVNFTGGLSIATGGNEAFRTIGGGTVNVTGTNTLSSTGAVSLEVSGGTTIGGSGLTFQSIAKNGGANGVILNGTGAGFLTVTGTGSPAAAGSGGTIQNTTGDGISLTNVGGVVTLNGMATSNVAGTDVFVSGGAANVTYAGTITNQAGKGKSVDVTGKTGGTVLFSGAIDDGGNGITLTNNSGATVNFTGGLTLSTGASAAFAATGGGTVSVTGTANTITTTTGTALNVTGTLIGSSGLNFRSINANGAPNGIVLSNTGSAGGLTVAGNGGNCTVADPTCTGGTIQSTTGVGVALTNTTGVSLTRMRILNTGSHGVSGTGVSSFTFASGINHGAGDGNDEDAFNFGTLGQTNLTGTLSITNSAVRKFVENGLVVRNNTGALTITITNTTFQDNNDEDPTPGTPDFGANGLLLEATGSAGISLNVTGSTFDEIESAAIQFEAEGSGTNDVNIIGNTFSHPSSITNFEVGGGIVLITDTNGSGNPAELTFDVQGNFFNLVSGVGVNIVGEGNADGRIGGDIAANLSGPGGANQGNRFLQAGSSNGCAEDAIRLDDDGNFNSVQAPVTTWRILVKNNSIDAHNGVDAGGGDLCAGTSGDQGIVVFVRDSASTFHGTFTSNTITDSQGQGMRVFVADRDNADGISNGPNVFLTVNSNSFANITHADGISMSVDDLADLCANVTGNTVDGNIFLERRVATSVFHVPQASTAAISASNGGAPVTLGAQPLAFNTTCSVALPTNP